MTCPNCQRPIEVDNVRGKPADARGYCLGVETCIQESPQNAVLRRRRAPRDLTLRMLGPVRGRSL